MHHSSSSFPSSTSFPSFPSTPRRISTLPGASGLGARTVSPTDSVRRRSHVPSTIPPVPPLPSSVRLRAVSGIPRRPQQSTPSTPLRSRRESREPQKETKESKESKETRDHHKTCPGASPDEQVAAVVAARSTPDDLVLLNSQASKIPALTPAEAFKSHSSSITLYERGEIQDYPEIHTLGRQSAKTRGNDISPDNNFGFDDDRGDYLIVSGDHLAYRFEIIDLVGKGSFGQVVRCFDRRNGGLAAVKIIRNKKRFHQQALVEVKIITDLNSADPGDTHNLLRITHSFYFRGHLCIATDLLGINLYQFIKANNFRGSPLTLVRAFARQILTALLLLRKKNIIHCDLKPENVLLVHPTKARIRVIDFGSSCFENERVYTYIQSRFYRSPEVILGLSYGMPIDMWSLGCILAELHTGYPLFPGENEQEQLACIIELFGPPEKLLIEKSARRKLFFDSAGKPRPFVSSKNKKRRPMSKSLQQALKTDDPAFIDFVAKCLAWNPENRLLPDDALRHEYITGAKLCPKPLHQEYTVPRPLPQLPNKPPTKIPISPFKKSQKNPPRPRAISSSYSSSNIRAPYIPTVPPQNIIQKTRLL